MRATRWWSTVVCATTLLACACNDPARQRKAQRREQERQLHALLSGSDDGGLSVLGDQFGLVGDMFERDRKAKQAGKLKWPEWLDFGAAARAKKKSGDGFDLSKLFQTKPKRTSSSWTDQP